MRAKTSPVRSVSTIQPCLALRERAVELAAINGRSEQDVSKSDWEHEI